MTIEDNIYPVKVLPNEVAIVVAGTNSAPYLEETLKSALAQGCQVIYSDDCSFDQSVLIAEKLGVTTLTSDSKSGVCKARNKGYRATNANNLIFLDSDDILTKNFVTEHLKALKSKPNTPFAYGPAQCFGKTNQLYKAPEWHTYDKWWRNTVNTSSIWRREVLEAVGGWNESLETMWDWDLALKCQRFGSPVTSKAVLKYRQHEGSFSNRCNEKDDSIHIREKIRRNNTTLTVASLISGRLGDNWLIKWLDNLALMVKFLNIPTELILFFHNAKEQTYIYNYGQIFTNIRCQSLTKKINKTNNYQKMSDTSNLLAEYSSKVQTIANGDLIFLIEDDIYPNLRALQTLFTDVTEGDIPVTAVAAPYLNRHTKKIVGGEKLLKNGQLSHLKTLPANKILIECVGTGCFLYWRDRPTTPKFWRPYTDKVGSKFAAHDFAFCEDIYKLGGKVLLNPDVNVAHVESENKFLWIPQPSLKSKKTLN